MEFDSITCEVIGNQLTVFSNGRQVPINQRQLICVLVKAMKELNGQLPEILKIREIEVTEEEVVEQWFEDKALDTYMGVLSEQIAEIGEDPIDAHARSSVGARTVREAMENKRSRHS